MQKLERSSVGEPGARALVRVWDPVVRIFHWGVVISFATAWFTSHSSELVHHLAGYAAFGLILMRIVWGFLGTPYARFTQFLRRPLTVLAYLRSMAAGNEARYVGHNPAGGAMVITLIVVMAGTAVSGWMMTTDRFWGVTWVADMHSLLAHGLLLLVGVHFAGVILASFRHREDLIGAMISGRKRSAAEGEIT